TPSPSALHTIWQKRSIASTRASHGPHLRRSSRRRRNLRASTSPPLPPHPTRPQPKMAPTPSTSSPLSAIASSHTARASPTTPAAATWGAPPNRHADPPRSESNAIVAPRRQQDARLRLATSDRLRLDVAMTAEREIYSWAGANKFEEGEIDELIPRGAMGTGPFASFLLSLFVGRPARFIFEGDTKVDGRTLYE